MDIFLKASAGILVAVVFNQVIAKQGKDLSVLLTLVACAMVSIIAFEFLGEIVSFLERLARLGKLNQEILSILFKCVGVGILGEVTGAVCTDAGNAALGKVLQLLASTIILWISLPLFTQIIDLVEQILGAA